MRFPFLLAVLTLVLSCGNEPTPTRLRSVCAEDVLGQTFTPDMEQTGPAGYTVKLVDVNPNPPSEGNNDWNFEILLPSGDPLLDANVFVKPWMPNHGHGTAIKPIVTSPETDQTSYLVSPVNLRMPGHWRIGFEIADSDSTVVDVVEYHFCIEG